MRLWVLSKRLASIQSIVVDLWRLFCAESITWMVDAKSTNMLRSLARFQKIVLYLGIPLSSVFNVEESVELVILSKGKGASC